LLPARGPPRRVASGPAVRSRYGHRVQGLPQGLDALAAALLAVGALLAVAYLVWARPRVEAALASAGPAARPLALTILVALALGIGGAPFLTWRVVEDVRYTSALDPWLVENYGVSVFEVHPAAHERAAELMPPSDTYALRTDPEIERTRRAAFEQWALTKLLPRRAVADVDDAKWLLTLGVRPEEVDDRVERTWRLHPGGRGVPPSYIGKLRA
jgi:hypothetical protein